MDDNIISVFSPDTHEEIEIFAHQIKVRDFFDEDRIIRIGNSESKSEIIIAMVEGGRNIPFEKKEKILVWREKQK